MTIDVFVEAEPCSCRATANWLHGVSGAITGCADAVHAVRNGSDAHWSGDTFEHFRNRMTDASKQADDLASTTQRVAKALQTFADDIDTVSSRMDVAVSVAKTAGLTITNDNIGDPMGTPLPLVTSGDMPPSSTDRRAHAAAMHAHTTQTQAYQEAAATVAEARKIERQAHQRLVSVLGDLKDHAHFTALDFLTGGIGALNGAKLGWEREIRRLDRARAHWEELASKQWKTEPRDAARAVRMREIAKAKGLVAEELAESNGNLLKGVPEGVRNTLDRSLADLKGLPPNVANVARRFPYVGLLITAGEATNDIMLGESVTKTVIGSGASLVSGTVATEAVLALAAGGGPATLMAVGIGIGVSFGVGYVIDNYGDDIVNGAEAAGGWVGDRAVDIGHGAQDAAHWVGDHVSDTAKDVKHVAGSAIHSAKRWLHL